MQAKSLKVMKMMTMIVMLKCDYLYQVFGQGLLTICNKYRSFDKSVYDLRLDNILISGALNKCSYVLFLSWFTDNIYRIRLEIVGNMMLEKVIPNNAVQL